MPNKILSSIAKWMKAPGAHPPSTVPDAQPSLDIEAGITRVGGDKALYLSLLNQLKDRYASAAEELNRLAKNNDWQTISQKAHTIKGVAGNLGANKLFSSAEALEFIEMNDSKPAKAKLAAFEKELTEVLKAIDSLS